MLHYLTLFVKARYVHVERLLLLLVDVVHVSELLRKASHLFSEHQVFEFTVNHELRTLAAQFTEESLFFLL